MPVHGDDPRLRRCGFAKLFGDGGKLDYVIRKYEILLGRHSKTKAVDVSLEQHKLASREHAYIRYNFDNRQWELHVLGKNGVKINGVDMKPGNPGGSGPHPLPSQTMLQVGDDLTFYFLLPKDPKDVVRKRKLGSLAIPPHMAPALKRSNTTSSRPGSTATKAAAAAPPPDVMKMFMQATQPMSQPQAQPQPATVQVQQVQPAPIAQPAAQQAQQVVVAQPRVPQQQVQQAVPVVAPPVTAAASLQPQPAAVADAGAKSSQPTAITPDVLAAAQQQLLGNLLSNPAQLQHLLNLSIQRQQGRGAPPTGAATMQMGAMQPQPVLMQPQMQQGMQAQAQPQVVQAAAAAARPPQAAQPVQSMLPAQPAAVAAVGAQGLNAAALISRLPPQQQAFLAALPPQQQQMALSSLLAQQQQMALAQMAQAQAQQRR